MAKQKLSERDTTTIVAGGYIHIILPGVTPGIFNSYKISVTSLLSGVGNTPIEGVDLTGNINVPIAANTFVDKIFVFQAGGTPIVRIGLTPNGEEIMPDTTITDSQLVKPEQISQGVTLYFTINSGYIDYRIDTINNLR
jgi:hypothetical protein